MVDKSAHYLMNKGGVYYFTRHVPNDLQRHYDKPRIVMCLETRNKMSALKASQSLASKLDDFWLQMRISNMDVPAANLLTKGQPKKTFTSCAPKLSDALEKYCRLKGKVRGEQFFKAAHRNIGYVIQNLGDRPLGTYSSTEAAVLRDWLIDRKLSTPSIKRIFSTIRAVINLTIQEDGLNCTNAFAKTFLPSEARPKRASISPEDIKRIQALCLYIADERRLLVALILSACKDDALVQGSDGNDVFGNTPEDQIFRGRLGNDVYSYLLAGTDRITDTGGTDELRVSVVDAEGVSIQTSFKRVWDDLVVTQSGEGNSVTVEGAFVAGTALEAVTLVYEDGNRPDQAFDLIGSAEDSPDGNTNMFVGTEAADTIESAQSGWFFGAGGNDTITIESGSNTIHGGNGDDVITLGAGDDKVFAGAGNDTIHAGLGANEVYAQAGNDIVLAAGGDDKIVGGTGDDVLAGGEGFDEFVFSTNDGKDKITDFNVKEDTITLAGFGYKDQEDIMAHVVETLDGSILFNDQGTEIEGLNLDEALVDMDLQVLEFMTMEGDMGAMRDGSGGGDSWCCTASYKRGAMAIREVKELRKWHVKQSRVWQEGYHIWGRIVADKWLLKSKWAAKGTQDLFNLIMHKKITFRGLLAWVVITPPAMLIGSYIVLSQKLDRLLGRSLVRGITG